MVTQQLILLYHSHTNMSKVKRAVRKLGLPVEIVWDCEESSWAFTCPADTDDIKYLALEKILLGFIAFYGNN
jgi:hypothetical protein